MKLGKVLAADYKGCLDEKGGVVAGTVYDDCDDDRILVKLGYPDLTLGAFLGEPIDEFTGLFNQCYPS